MLLKKWMISLTMLFLVSFMLPSNAFYGSAAAADMITWGEKQSAVYDKLHPYTLNWSGNVLNQGGLNLLDLEYTTDSDEADLIMNQYGSIGALAILDRGTEKLSDPTRRDLKGFTNSYTMKQGSVYFIVLHDGSHAKLQIDRILPDNGLTVTKVMFSYVLEQPDAEQPKAPQDGSSGTSSSEGDVSIPLGSPEQDIKTVKTAYEFEYDGGSITIPWNKIGSETSWDIFRSDNGAPYVKMTDFKLTVPEFTDNYTFPGHTYLYKVAAYDRNGKLVSISTPLKVVILDAAFGPQIVLQIDNTKAYINDEEYVLEAAPFIHDGRTVVPLRFITEALGAELEWNGAERSITLTRGEDTIVLVIDRSEAVVNGKKIMMDVPAIIHNNKTMVPVRFISENFNQKITFDDKTRTILIVGAGNETADEASAPAPDGGSSEAPPASETTVDYFIGSWNMWVPAGRNGASGGVLTIHADGTASFYWNGPQTGIWTFDEQTGKLYLIDYKSGGDWTVVMTDEGIRVSSFGVYETGTRRE